MLEVLASANVAQAETEFASVLLEELMETSITSITKMEIPLKKSPVTAFVITQDEIIRKGYHHLTNILKNTARIHTANLSFTERAITEIYVRGYYANNKITVLVDSIKIPPPTSEPITFLDTIPLIGVKQVEISFGSASSIYSADAMLATINIVTQDGETIDGAHVKATAGNFDTGEVQVVSGSKLIQVLSVSLTGSFQRSGKEYLVEHYPSEYASIEPVNLNKQNHNVHFKLKYKDFALSHYRLFNKINSSIGFRPLAPDLYDYSGAAFFENLNQTFNATYAWDIDQFWQTKSSLSYESNQLMPESSYGDYGSVEYKAWLGEAMRFSQNVIYQHNQISWLNGVEPASLDSTPKYSADNPDFNKVHTTYQNYAAFSRLDYAWTDNLTTSASLRLDSDSRYSPDFNARLGFSWQAINPCIFLAHGVLPILPLRHCLFTKNGEMKRFLFIIVLIPFVSYTNQHLRTGHGY